MIGWAASWIWWFVWRLAASLVCLWTIQNVAHQQGYYIEFKTLLVIGLCTIVGIRLWMPTIKTTKSHVSDSDIIHPHD